MIDQHDTFQSDLIQQYAGFETVNDKGYLESHVRTFPSK